MKNLIGDQQTFLPETIMTEIIAYSSSENYLKDNEAYLEENELENNIILGNCYKSAKSKSNISESFFITCFENKIIKATSMVSDHRAIIYGDNSSEKYINSLAEYYLKNSVALSGVMGLTKSAKIFSENFHTGKTITRNLLLHELININEIKLAEGSFEKAEKQDLEIISELEYQFIKESDIVRGRTRNDMLSTTKELIKSNSVFKWIANGNIVSVSIITRRTKSTGIIGLVYTPPEFRGKGYATGCVLKLSEQILKSGYKSCGLYTDVSNPVSNSIYRKIGYKKISEFNDIRFLY